MSSGCVKAHPLCLYVCLFVILGRRMVMKGDCDDISAWAISVARSTKLGKAKASKCGMGSRTVPTLFFLCRFRNTIINKKRTYT